MTEFDGTMEVAAVTVLNADPALLCAARRCRRYCDQRIALGVEVSRGQGSSIRTPKTRCFYPTGLSRRPMLGDNRAGLLI